MKQEDKQRVILRLREQKLFQDPSRENVIGEERRTIHIVEACFSLSEHAGIYLQV